MDIGLQMSKYGCLWLGARFDLAPGMSDAQRTDISLVQISGNRGVEMLIAATCRPFGGKSSSSIQSRCSTEEYTIQRVHRQPDPFNHQAECP